MPAGAYRAQGNLPAAARTVKLAPHPGMAILMRQMTGAEDSDGGAGFLYFFPDEEISAGEVRAILAGDNHERRCWVVSHLLRYAQWDDIWQFVSRDEVRQLFAELDLPDNLRAAWARMLKIEAPVA